MLAESIDPRRLIDYAEDDSYWIQQKLDGHRILLNCRADSITALERKGKVSQHNSKFNSVAWLSMLLPLKGKGIIFDGEWLDNILWVFDMPYLEGLIGYETPYQDRLAALETFVHATETKNSNLAVRRLVPTARTTDQKLDLIGYCIAQHAEGVMVKRVNARYVCGRTTGILKAKFTKTADLVVTALNFGGRDNAVLCAWENQTLIEVGRCSTIGKPPVKIGDVVEVKYLYASNSNRLVQPTLLKIRTDKDSQDCLIDQLQMTQKEVIQLT